MTQPEPCRHYDIVGPHPLFPNQAKDMGTCRLCGRQRHYKLSMEDKGYNDLRVQWPSYTASEREIAGYLADHLGREA